MADDNKKYVARVPIVPDDFEFQDEHKNHELVMDFEKDDIYVKKESGYTNITGKIKDEIKQIQDGSAVIHVVTDQTVPPIKERTENHWYWVVTKAEEIGGGAVATSSYIYYGLIKTYYPSKNYLLIGQNMTSGLDTVPFTILEGYCPCFYIPINYGASFKNHNTGENIEYTIEDRIYAMNTTAGSYVAYDVYTLKLYEPGDYMIDLDLTGSDNFTIAFDTNEPTISGLVLPESLHVHDGDNIGTIPDPTWDDPRFLFKGWSTSKIAATIIDPAAYKPEMNMTLFAWFEYESDPNLLTYFATYENTDEGVSN